MKKSIIIAIIAVTTQVHAAALDGIKLPQGTKMPAMHFRGHIPKKQTTAKNTHVEKKLGGKSLSSKQHESKLILPPRGIIQRLQDVQETRVLKILARDYLADTEKIAVTLKNAGYRLYKKRTLARDKNWMFWVKSQAGVPLFKVEVVWQDKAAKTAELFLWSWDDKTQMSLSDRSDLVKIFGDVK
jgi:hypothetical protein